MSQLQDGQASPPDQSQGPQLHVGEAGGSGESQLPLVAGIVPINAPVPMHVPVAPASLPVQPIVPQKPPPPKQSPPRPAKVRVALLRDSWLGSAGDVIMVDPDVADGAHKMGAVDPHPEAVKAAYKAKKRE